MGRQQITTDPRIPAAAKQIVDDLDQVLTVVPSADEWVG
jgi:hypothetical protein